MTNAVTGSTQSLPTTTSIGPSMPPGLPVVAGGPTDPALAEDQAATTAALTPQAATGGTASLVDAAIARQLGVVTGGGADAPQDDPRFGIPAFVRQFLPEGDAPATAAEGAYQQQGPSSQRPGTGDAPGQMVQQGWAWIGCAPPMPPGKGELPPGKGELPPMPPPPGKGELPPMPPPGKGELPPPPSPGKLPPPPPTKGSPVQEPGQRGRGTYTVTRGDTLSKIAPNYGVSWQQLYWANRDQIKHPDQIQPGQVLRIPSRKLQVPDFSYTPKSPSNKEQPDRPRHRRPEPTERPSPPPTSRRSSEPPPASDPGSSATLPDAPPAPPGGELPPALPDGATS